jgi:hypothetical protein
MRRDERCSRQGPNIAARNAAPTTSPTTRNIDTSRWQLADIPKHAIGATIIVTFCLLLSTLPMHSGGKKVSRDEYITQYSL